MEAGRIFIRNTDGTTVRLVEKHQDIAMTFIYLNTVNGRYFDVRDLPERFIRNERDAVMAGDRAAHKRCIKRALSEGHEFG